MANLVVKNIRESDGNVILYKIKNEIQKPILLFLNMNQINIGNIEVKAVEEISYLPATKLYVVKTANAYLFASALHVIENDVLYNFTMDDNEILNLEEI